MAAPPVAPSVVKHSISDSQISILAETSAAAKAMAYCPYSNFRVGAVILMRYGHHISGANVENASYSVGLCAERAAFAKAVVRTPVALTVQPLYSTA
ncbi:MAG: hypothetical protein M1816_005373 [Peltula sp. TS41687]|nr:MAG: hypothetical protein M1816_005373 [Peltula sp. TS41687]